MKNLLNFKRLLSNSHEKQSPQRFTRYAAMLIMLLTLGVGQMWGYNASNTDVYFDNTNAAWDYSTTNNDYIYCLIGRDHDWGSGNGVYSQGLKLSPIANTQLFHKHIDTWSNYDSFCFFHTDNSDWGDATSGNDNNSSPDTRRTYGAGYTNEYNIDMSQAYIFTAASGSNNANLSLATFTTYEGINKTQTIQVRISEDNGSTYSDAANFAAWPGSITVARTYLSAADASSSPATTAMTSSTTIGALTSSITFTGTNTTEYTFAGWSNTTSSPDGNKSKTYTITDASTTYAFYKRNQYTVSYGVYNSANGSVSLNSGSAVTSSSSSTLNHGTAISFTATPNSGYQVEGWYSDAACSSNKKLQSGGTSYNAGTLTAATTIYVKFEARTGGTITLSAGTGGQVSNNNSSWSSSASITDITTNDDVNIYARANTGYSFNTWTKSSGQGSVKTNSASGVFTPVAWEDATVTASFNEVTVTVSPTCAYDHGNPSYSNPTASNSGTVGIVSTSQLVAPAAGTGYRFAGWTLSNNLVVTSGNAATDRTITVRTNGDGNAVTATANYNEVLTTGWKIIGQSTGNAPFSSWTYASSTNTMAKASGHSTESVVYATVTVAAASVTGDSYEFKVTGDGSTLYGFGTNGDDHIMFDQTKTNQTVYSNSNNDHALRFKPNVAGNYTFKVDYSGSDPKVSVTFPTSYTLTYSVGDVAGNDGSITSSPTTASGSKVLSGNTVTLTAPDAADGYTWKGWYLNSDGSGEQQEDDQEYAVTVSSDKTLYACYTEDMHNVTVNAQTGGTVSYNGGVAGSSCTARAGIATASANIVATASDGYYFAGWLLPDGTITKATESTYNGATSTYTIRATADSKTVTALFNVRYALLGSQDATGNPKGGMPGWGEGNEAPFTYSDGTYTKTVGLTVPNVNYKFRIVDRRASSHISYGLSSKAVIPADGSYHDLASTSADAQLATAGVGTYTLTVQTNASGYPKVMISNPTSYLITMGTTTFFDENGAQASSETDATGSAIATSGGNVTAEDGDSYTIVNGNYVKNSGSVTFKAAPNSGYSFMGWFSNSSCTTPIVHNGTTIVVNEGDKTLALSSIDGSKTVYAKFTENMATVTLNTTGSGNVQIYKNSAWSDVDGTVKVGVHTNYTIKAVPASGYYVSGWTVSDGADCNVASTAGRDDNDAQSTTLRGLGSGTTGTVTANFTENEKIYFRNIFDDGAGSVTRWSAVYVGYSDHWDNSTNCGGGPCGADTYGCATAQMTQIGTSDVYWAYVPRAFTASNSTTVVFFDYDMSTWKHFSGHNAARRSDYNKALNMFVPNHTSSGTTNATVYYSNGYWMQYEAEVGKGGSYYLKRLNDAGTGYVDIGEMTSIADGVHQLQYTFRVDNLTSTKNKYMFSSAAGLNYQTHENITSINCTNVNVFEDNGALPRFEMEPTSEGNYTFILDQTGDVMQLTVIYPVSPGDYRLKHTYNDGSEKTTYSDVIKGLTASTAMTHSMYLSSAGDETLVLQECTEIDEDTKQPVWSDGDATNLSGVTSKVGTDGDGVYQFDITVNTTTDKVNSVANIAKYTGDYYIKTDCAPGGWVNYKQNVMGENTINASDFDRYFCKNVANQTNVKFVIANDYNIAITDTIIQDATYLTTAGGGSSKEYMPESSCIRFSYNSATNEAKRAYLRYSNNNNFLNIIPSATGKVYDAASAGNDLYGTDGSATATNKFGNDDGNFVYRKTVYAVSGATIDVKAEYTGNTKIQALITGQTLITSNNASPRYPVRLVYDFRTNHLTAAWEASEGLTDQLSNIEFIYIRNGQEAADQVSLGTGGAISGSKVCAAFQFDYSDYVGQVGSWTSDTYGKCMFYFSFPFDVNVGDIFGLGDYGKAWKLQYYDGAERAKKGFFRGDGTTTFWKDVPADSVLTKNVGYSLLLDNDYFNTTASGMVFEGKTSGSAFLYFPSANAITLGQGATSIDVPSHECTLTQYWTEGGKTLYHSKTDSHWNMMGVPLFQSQTGDYSATFKAKVDYTAENPFGYLYEWTPATNTLAIVDAKSFTFKSMNAYMVQYTGTVNFTGSHVAASVAARHKKEVQNYTIDLEVLNSDDEHINRTYVELREGASDDFELNEDVYMTLNGKNVNVYSYAGDYDVAANVLSVANHIVPVGVVVKANGTYKFSMPSNFSGTVTLVDKFAQTRTNLAIEDYEVTLNKGTINDRFELEINILNAPTAIDGVEGGSLKDGNAHKYIENGVMYILENGRIYNARGNRVK